MKIISLPFPSYKWLWATVACTEGLNDPLVFHGVTRCLHHLEGHNLKYNSQAFTNAMYRLSHEVGDRIDIDLRRRTGERNLIRNSGQYWRALGIIPYTSRGMISLTPFGRMVAKQEISVDTFAAAIVLWFSLPNPATYNRHEISLWKNHGLCIHPLRLILEIVLRLASLHGQKEAYITPNELGRVVIPLAGCKASAEEYCKQLLEFRANPSLFKDWPNCCPRENDYRIIREFLLFLANYGYLEEQKDDGQSRFNFPFYMPKEQQNAISELVHDYSPPVHIEEAIRLLDKTNNAVSSSIARGAAIGRQNRAKQTVFRRDVLNTYKRCLVTNVRMPEILEAAHIIPYRYRGDDGVANELALRSDIHLLFDTGNLAISPEGELFLSPRARLDYGAAIPPFISLPDTVSREALRWRWENVNGK